MSPVSSMMVKPSIFPTPVIVCSTLTAGVSFTINHIAAVGIPATFGFIWIDDPGLVFYLGAGMAVVSLLLALMIPKDPKSGNETTLTASASDPDLQHAR